MTKGRLLASLVLWAFLGATMVRAAYLEDLPTTLRQPDGSLLQCLISGDEFYHRVHDKAGYSIIQNPTTGWYVYATRERGDLAPTALVPGRDDPSRALVPGLMPDPEIIRRIHEALPYMAGQGTRTPSTGTINNLVVFIRFLDQDEFGGSAGSYDDAFNADSPNAVSLSNFFQEASYGNLTVSSTLYPVPSGGLIVSYQDTHNRSYYCPYDPVYAPDGYSGDFQRMDREHTLLANAVAAIASAVPPGLDIDADNDGYVDNMCFVVRGNPTAWATLLWPHMWALYSRQVYIHGKRVWGYNFQIEAMFTVSILCHEMGHSVGFPDLYHYYYGTNLSPTGNWDLMCDTSNPPTHMGAYMKSYYTGWIGAIPEITTPGTYQINPLTSPTNNCYKIASPNSPSEYFVVEYRRKTGTFEIGCPGSGLLVYRINGNFAGYGNAGYDGITQFDEVYLYRPGGTISTNGDTNVAFFSSASDRTDINDDTNPSSFLHDGSPGGLNISDVGVAGETISFSVNTASLGACCEPGTCTITYESACPMPGLWQGEWTTCSPNPCPPAGVCCGLGSCTLTYPADCLAPNVWHPEWTSCLPDPCPPAGACCTPLTGVCTYTFQPDCAPPNNWFGPGSSCAPNPCPQYGACCTLTGACSITLQSSCPAPSSWFSTWVSCDPNPCPQPGACCHLNGSCEFVVLSHCLPAGSSYFVGEGIPCNPDPCAALGACCHPNLTCEILPASQCTDQWMGPGVFCLPAPCGPRGACCWSADGSCRLLTSYQCMANGGDLYLGDGTVCDPNPCPTSGLPSSPVIRELKVVVTPNPSIGPCTFWYSLPSASDLFLDVFDPAGKRVWSSEVRGAGPGIHSLDWDGRSSGGEELRVGVYFARLRLGGRILERTIIRIR